MHSAPASVHARSSGVSIDTVPLPEGASVSSHRSLRSSTIAAAVTVAPVTVSAWSRMSSGVISTSALNAIRNVNAVDPSCASGTDSKLAVSTGAAGTGPATCRAGATDSDRPSAVHSAPASVHARSSGVSIDTGPLPVGSSVSSHRLFSPPTRSAPVTVAPLTTNAWSRMSSGVISTSSLNAIRNVNALDPSCDNGAFSKAAISGSAAVAWPTAPFVIQSWYTLRLKNRVEFGPMTQIDL